MTDSDPPKRKRKRNRVPFKYEKLTPEFVFACGKLFCTQEEIGDLCGMAQQTVSQVLNGDPELSQAFRTGRAQGKMSLRRAQAKKAIEDENMVAQIWLGKQELGQADKREDKQQLDVNVAVQYIAAWGKTPQELAASPTAGSLPAPSDNPSPPPETPEDDEPDKQDQDSPDDDEVIDGTAIEDPAD